MMYRIDVDVSRYCRDDILRAAKDCGLTAADIEEDGTDITLSTSNLHRAVWLAEALTILEVSFDYRVYNY